MSSSPAAHPGPSRRPRRTRPGAMVALALAAAFAPSQASAQEARPDSTVMTRPPLSGFFLLTQEQYDRLKSPGADTLWGIDTTGIRAGVLGDLVMRMPTDTAGSFESLITARFADRASVVAAIGEVVLTPVSDDSATASAVVVDDALRPPPRDPPDDAFRVLLDSALQARVQPFTPLDVGPAVPDPALALQPFVGKWFPDEHMFRTAIRLAFAQAGDPISEEGVDRVLTLAHRPLGRRPDSLFLQPLAWTGAGCGCGVYARGEPWEPEFYGFYRFWDAPQGETGLAARDTLDLSMLTRIGYYGLTFDAQGRLRDGLHWRSGRYPGQALPFRRRDFTDFAVTAHNHKVNVDLVVYQSDWSWLEGVLDGAPDQVMAVFDTLSRSMLQAISPRLDDVMDRIKPVISLGQSPRRTLGDGITLDFDFSRVSPEAQAKLFDLLTSREYFKALADSLGARAADNIRVLDLDLDYRLNLVVPLNCVVETAAGHDPTGRCVFYTPDHLSTLRRAGVDLFLIDMTNVAGSDSLAPASLDERTRLLRASLNHLTVEKQHDLVPAVIPLVDPSPSDSHAITDFIEASDLSFRGVGSWSPAAMGMINGDLRRVFLPLPREGSLDARIHPLEQTLCNFMCPLRWWIRALIFLAALAYLVFWLWSEADFGLKRFYETRAHSIVVVFFCLILVATLWCDPFWKTQKTLIVSVVALAGLVYFVFAQIRLRKERDYP